MTTITVRDAGAFGFYTTPIAGTGRTAGDALGVRGQVEQAQALALALRAAIDQARGAGVDAFRPGDGRLALPAGLDPAERDRLFERVMGHAWAGGPLTLAQWSRALDELDHWAGAAASTLPPGAGGGIRQVRGTWYVNGEPYSLSELFTANRVNTLAELDALAAASLNLIAANNEKTKALSALMAQLFEKHEKNTWSYESAVAVTYTFPNTTTVYTIVPAVRTDLKVPWGWIDLAGQKTAIDASLTGFEKAIQNFGPAGLLPTGSAVAYPVTGDQLLAYARQFLGADSLIEKAYNTGTRTLDRAYSALIGLNQTEFRGLIDEVEKIIAALAADNQVAQLRNETLFNSRTNLLEGLGSFLKGQQGVRSSVARNA